MDASVKTAPRKKSATLRRLLKFIISTYKVTFSLSMLAIIIAAASTVAGSLFLQRLIDDYIVPMTKQSVPNFGTLLQAIVVMGTIYLIGVIATFFFTRTMAVLGQRLQKKIRDEMFIHMEKLPISYFDQNDYGDVMSRFTNDVDTLMQMISQSIPQFLNSLFNLVFVVIGMLTLSPLLTLISFVVFGLSIGVVKFLTSKSSSYFKQQQNKMGHVNGYGEEILNGLKVVKVFSHEPMVKAQFNLLNQDLKTVSGNANGFATMLFPIMGNVGNLLYVLIALIGGTFVVNGVSGLTLGAIAAFLQLSRSFSMPIAQISQQLNTIVLALAGAQRIFQLQDEVEEEDHGQVTITHDDQVKSQWFWHNTADGSTRPVRGKIVFEHVDFGYVPGKTILHDINIDAKPGMKIALVGQTGAGKTTISNMINRFYEISAGKLTFDGIDVRDINKSALRQAMAIVLQETNLFSGTVMDNIRFGNPEATDNEIFHAAKLAHADQFIKDLENGFNTRIDGDGSDLSQGQKQLLSIARAMVSDTPLMILDEATSSIDTKTERLVQAGMDNLLAGRTSFVIAHRLSTIANADLILVIDHGRIIEQGNHEELIEKHGEYYQLYTGKKELD